MTKIGEINCHYLDWNSITSTSSEGAEGGNILGFIKGDYFSTYIAHGKSQCCDVRFKEVMILGSLLIGLNHQPFPACQFGCITYPKWIESSNINKVSVVNTTKVFGKCECLIIVSSISHPHFLPLSCRQ